MAKEKPILNVVFVGHVDHGKSTCIGRLFYESGAVSEQEMAKLKEEAAKHGKQGFEFAYVMDNLKEERERGVTINLSYKKILTKNYEVTIIDAPGHKDFVKNMITGASQADAAFLVVAADGGVQPQTTEHVSLLRTMGVNNLAVIVNKMDTVDYSQEKFEEVKKKVTEVLARVGYKNISFIPGSALMGQGVCKKADKMPWYTGPTVLEQIDNFPKPEKPIGLPMRLPIQDVYEITGIGTVPVGKIETGVMKVGQKVIILPGRSGTGITGEVRSIEAHHEQLKEAEAGDNVGVNIRGVGKKDITRGDVICDASAPAKMVEEFEARVAVINHPTVIAKGYTPVFHVHTAQVPCQFVELKAKLDPATGQVAQENPDFLKNGDVAIVKIKPIGNLVLETAEQNPYMSRFAIRDAGITVAAGVCKSLVEKKI
ncbi:MAG: translation elongation factor EF-1 subunit alpha [Candidatus Pacearchaeota archaeon]